jgi:hypothetical protein
MTEIVDMSTYGCIELTMYGKRWNHMAGLERKVKAMRRQQQQADKRAAKAAKKQERKAGRQPQ